MPLDSLAVFESQGVFTRGLGAGPSSMEEDYEEGRSQNKYKPHFEGFLQSAPGGSENQN